MPGIYVAINPWQPVLQLLYIPPDWSAQRHRSLDTSTCHPLVTKINIAMYYSEGFSSKKWLVLTIHTVLGCVNGPTVLVRFLICHALLIRPSEPRLTTQPARVQPDSKRFKFAKEEELLEFAKGLVPENTSKSTKWALNNFDAWMKARNVSYPDSPVPGDILMSSDPELLNLHLCYRN